MSAGLAKQACLLINVHPCVTGGELQASADVTTHAPSEAATPVLRRTLASRCRASPPPLSAFAPAQMHLAVLLLLVHLIAQPLRTLASCGCREGMHLLCAKGHVPACCSFLLSHQHASSQPADQGSTW